MDAASLRKIVEAHRAAATSRRDIDKEIYIVRRRWELYTKPDGQKIIAARRQALDEAKANLAKEKATYEAEIEKLRKAREEAPQYRHDALPDEIKIAAYLASVAGESTTKIRIALGFGDFQKAKDFIAEGKKLKEAQDGLSTTEKEEW